MKKLLLGLVIIMAMIFSYSYQLPIMSTGEAIVSAKKHLQNPPGVVPVLMSQIYLGESKIYYG